MLQTSPHSLALLPARSQPVSNLAEQAALILLQQLVGIVEQAGLEVELLHDLLVASGFPAVDG